MDLSIECDSSVMGSLFQQIIGDLKNTSPLWEDFVNKASKLHSCLRAVIQAISSYLDAFQKIADAATNSRGASKEIGTALTRVCLRHKAVETRMKTFNSAIMDCLIVPLQDKLEDWKRQITTIDKEHAKDYKRCRLELKKRSNDTLRLQKKARKEQSDSIQSLVDLHMHDVSVRRAELEEVERKSLRAAMIEERLRYCSFVNMLQPVVKSEFEVMSELGHLQEAMESIAVVTKDPNTLPQASEEIILEAKPSSNLYPESPSCGSNSLGSRKSSLCSISSVNSSGSSNSPGNHNYHRSLSQLISPAMRLIPGESSDSGFCSTPVLTTQSSTSTSQSHVVSTWPPHSQDVVQATDRPHTISSAYEKGHQRPALTVYTFQKPEIISESQKSPGSILCRPPLPVRCSSLERASPSVGMRNTNNITQRQCPSPIPAYITKELPNFQPTYANMTELTALSQNTNSQQQQLVQPQFPKALNYPNKSTTSRMSSDSSAENNYQAYSSSDLSLNANTMSSAASFTLLEGSLPTEQGKVSGIDANKECEAELKIVETDPTTNKISRTVSSKVETSPHGEDISRASVHQKASLFEKLEREQNSYNCPNNQTNRTLLVNADNNSLPKKEEIYKSNTWNEKESDKMYEDSIQELNNLIGELDSFQRDHDLKKLEGKTNCIIPLMADANPHNAFNVQIVQYTDLFNSPSKSAQNINSIENRPDCSDMINTHGMEQNHENINKCINVLYQQHNNTSSKDTVEFTANSDTINSTVFSDSSDNPCDLKYVKENSLIVVMRCKEQRKTDFVDTNLSDSLNRLSSFRSGPQSNPSTMDPSNPRNSSKEAGCTSRMTRRSSSNSIKPPPPIRRSSSVTPSHNSQELKSPKLLQDGCIVLSSESLPPPPAFLLDRSTKESSPVNVAETVKALTVIKHTPASPTIARRTNSQQISNQNVPLQPYTTNPSCGIYAQPKSMSKVSSFRMSNPCSQKGTPNILAQINARLLPNKQSCQQQCNTYKNTACRQQTYQENRTSHELSSSQPDASESASKAMNQPYPEDSRTTSYWPNQQLTQQSDAPRYHHHQLQQHFINCNSPTSATSQMPPSPALGILQKKQLKSDSFTQNHYQRNIVATNPFLTTTDIDCSYSSFGNNSRGCLENQSSMTSSLEKPGNILNKTKVEFLHNLNAKLAKQGLSGRAFAVRNFINSKALPNPRLCHESLMDQIKRGAILKHNRTINDRSAPKIR